MFRPGVVLAAAAACALLLVGCSASGSATTSTSSHPKVVAAFYPLQFAAEQVGGSHIDITTLTQAGVEPHDLELSAQQVASIASADVVLYIKGFQPAVDDAIAQEAAGKAVDVGAEITHLTTGGAVDPHIWLDPANMTAIGNALANRLASIDPDHAATYRTNARALAAQMVVLARQYQSGLARCASRTIVVSHAAFAYLAKAFGLQQVAIMGLSPDAEPSPARMAQVAQLMRADHVHTIYSETLVSPKVAQTLAQTTGAKAVVLDPLEGLKPGSTDNYVSVMQANLTALQANQGCRS